MLLRYSFDMTKEADAIENAVSGVLDAGWRTGDIKDANTPTDKIIGCTQMGQLIADNITKE